MPRLPHETRKPDFARDPRLLENRLRIRDGIFPLSPFNAVSDGDVPSRFDSRPLLRIDLAVVQKEHASGKQ